MKLWQGRFQDMRGRISGSAYPGPACIHEPTPQFMQHCRRGLIWPGAWHPTRKRMYTMQSSFGSPKYWKPRDDVNRFHSQGGSWNLAL